MSKLDFEIITKLGFLGEFVYDRHFLVELGFLRINPVKNRRKGTDSE
jgi:hypothetical protein